MALTKWPALASLQLDWQLKAWNEPTVQFVHSVSPAPGEYVPGPHSVWESLSRASTAYLEVVS